MAKGTVERARAALQSPDFRRLFHSRLASQFADGLFQASLVASVVFRPENQNTTVGLFKATLIVSLPFSVIGPFTGVFIDRWSRRRILVVAPLLRTAAVGLVLFDPQRAAVPFFAGALLVLSVNRFFLATAQAVVPRLVPAEDLLIANSLATVGGTVAVLVGVYVGGQVAGAAGSAPLVASVAAAWLATSRLAARIRSDLAPLQVPEDPGLLRHEIRRVAWELRDGIRRLARTPRALGPIASIALDQLGEGIVLTLSLVVFRDRFKQGIGSFSELLGAGAIGVFVGLATVGLLERHFRKETIVAGSFLAGGSVLLLESLHITGLTVLLASFAVGLTFAWKKVPIDTLVQESLPDGYRGRVFAVYDVLYNVARLAAAAVAIPLFTRLSDAQVVALVGTAFVLWAPALPRWVAHCPEVRIRFYEGARAEEWPRAVVWGGVEEDVEVRRSWREIRDGAALLCYRLVLRDGTVLDVSRSEPDGHWRLDAETSG